MAVQARPMARTEDEMRDYAVRGVPALASPEYARGVFDDGRRRR